jgi:hypothetical protein
MMLPILMCFTSGAGAGAGAGVGVGVGAGTGLAQPATITATSITTRRTDIKIFFLLYIFTPF